MKKINFKNLIVLGPLIYALHHFEEHIIFNFREWSLTHFADNNPIPTEVIAYSVLLTPVYYIMMNRIEPAKN
jgi:hypothetical protein